MVCFQPPSLLIGEIWVPVIHFCVEAHRLQSSLETGQKARIVQINFSKAFDRVSHQSIPYQLCSMGIGGSVLSLVTQFLSNHVMVDGFISKLVDVVSRMLQESALGPLLFLCIAITDLWQ